MAQLVGGVLDRATIIAEEKALLFLTVHHLHCLLLVRHRASLPLAGVRARGCFHNAGGN